MIKWIPEKKIDNVIVQELLKESLDQNQFTNYGPNVKKLEHFIRDKFKVNTTKSIIVVSNGSVALHILSAAIEFHNKRKLNWTTQSFTFPPSAQMNLHDAQIIDIDNDGGLDLSLLDSSVNGLIVTNIFGNVVDISKYEAWAKEHNAYLIFDNAATSYTFYKNKNCINYGTGSTISFHHTKPFGFGEGGAIIVDNEYERVVRAFTNFGIGLNTDHYIVREGTNGKMSDVSAAYILQYLYTKFDLIIQKHYDIYQYTVEKVKGFNGVKLFPSFHDNFIVPSCITLLFDQYDDKYEKRLLENDIYCRKYYFPLEKTKISQVFFDQILCIPCTIDMDFTTIDTIFSTLFP